MHIILLSGWAESGKDTCANYLAEKHGFKQFAFADSLKEECSKQYNFPLSLTNTHEGKASMHLERTIRQHLIDYANTQLQKNPYCFADEVAIKIQLGNYKKVVISDWRRIDELICLQKCFPTATIIPIRIQRHLVSPIPDRSEYELHYPFRYIIDNTKGKNELYNALDDFIYKHSS